METFHLVLKLPTCLYKLIQQRRSRLYRTNLLCYPVLHCLPTLWASTIFWNRSASWKASLVATSPALVSIILASSDCLSAWLSCLYWSSVPNRTCSSQDSRGKQTDCSSSSLAGDNSRNMGESCQVGMTGGNFGKHVMENCFGFSNSNFVWKLGCCFEFELFKNVWFSFRHIWHKSDTFWRFFPRIGYQP